MWSSELSAAGRLIVVSGPSGAGKSTVLRELPKHCKLPLQLSVSATTRKPRKGEIPGRDYHFLSHEEFNAMRQRGEFLECKEVFGRGDWYGTIAQQVEDGLAAGKWMVLEIDVQGALSLMENRTDLVTIFIHPGSLQELENRLRRRNTDDEQAILRRLQVARQELEALPRYMYEVKNTSIEQSVRQICQTLEEISVGANHA